MNFWRLRTSLNETFDVCSLYEKVAYVLKMVLLLYSFIGLVFLPDSIGYFIGTNFFGAVAKEIGRWFSYKNCATEIV